MTSRAVLIVDNSIEDCATFGRYLRRSTDHKYQVAEAHSGKEAFEWLRNETPDCIMLDYDMPEMNGIDVLSSLRDDSDWLPYPLIMLTGSGNTEVAIDAMKQGVSDYLIKDTVTQETLVRAIENAIEKHTLRENLNINRSLVQVRNSALEIANKALDESTTRYHDLIDRLPNLIWIFDADHRIIDVNSAWSEFTGYRRENAIEFDWLDAIHPDDRDAARDAFAGAVSKKGPYHSEYRMRNSNGKYRLLLNVANPHFTQHGEFLGYNGSSLDITEQRAVQEQLYSSQKLESLGRLASGVAHDFNNLIQAIMGYTELVADATTEDAEVTSYISHIASAAERAAALSSQLLMYARRKVVALTIIDINETILNMDSLFSRLIGEQYETVTILDTLPCFVCANASYMEQVLTNLVVNARDAMPNGGKILIETRHVILDDDIGAAQIGVSTGEYVMYSVGDTGTGITDDVREHIFEPFYTTKAPGKGTGLGLATCFGIVTQSHGTITVYSEPGLGTTFKVYLPAVSNNEQAAAVVRPTFATGGTETILLVDDEPLVRDIIARMLSKHGYTVLEARSGQEALMIASQYVSGIDLLLTDVIMPAMSGAETAQRFQTAQSTVNVKVLYMSGYTQTEIVAHGVLKPEIAFLTKPFSSAVLLQKIREILDSD